MNAPELTWGIAHKPQPGQMLSGDDCVAELTQPGMLACVIDGLGHGEKAHEAAARAAQTVRENVREDVDTLIKRCHQALVGTRGAVMSLASVDTAARKVTWAGVGNVAAVLLPANGNPQQARRHLLVHGGIVGYRLPNVKVFTENFMPGDTLIFATDGLRSGFIEDIPLGRPPQDLAEYLLKRHSRGTDDALALVIRYGVA